MFAKPLEYHEPEKKKKQHHENILKNTEETEEVYARCLQRDHKSSDVERDEAEAR